VWRTDGTFAGTVVLTTMSMFANLPYEPQQPTGCLAFTTFGDRTYFSGYDFAHGWEPWATDGTLAGTRMIEDLYPGKNHSWAVDFTVAGSHMFFSADTPNVGRELWAIGPRGGPSTRRRSVGMH
jgi:ELWxxDGT repeat protein